MIDGNARPCTTCERYVPELDFPRCIGSCCNKSSPGCRACVEKYIKAKINVSVKRAEITCLVCHASMSCSDVQELTTSKTFDQ